MDSNVEERIRNVMSAVFDMPVDEIDEYSSPDNIESWDSFNGLMLVSELENNFNVKFTMEEVLAVKKVSDIKEALRRHGVLEGI